MKKCSNSAIIIGLLICKLISQIRNQRLFSNPKKKKKSANPNFFYGVHSENPRKMHKNKNAPQKGFQPIVLANNVRTRTRDLE